MDLNSPDFVPSVFKCAKQNPKRKPMWYRGRRKRRFRRVKAETEDTKTQPKDDFPEEIQRPSSPPKEEKLSSIESETEAETVTKTVEPQTSSCLNKEPPSFKEPADILEQDRRVPIVLLKRVFTPVQGYQCQLCSQYYADLSQFLQHELLHQTGEVLNDDSSEELCTSQTDFTEVQQVQEPSFPCNMCDRSFTSTHHLKRHKLLHVKDGRKCNICGVIFCQRHNHVLFLPQTETVTEFEEEDDPSSIEPGNSLQESFESNGQSQSAITVTPPLTTSPQTVPSPPKNPTPLPKTLPRLPPPSHTRLFTKMPLPVLKKPYSGSYHMPGYSKCPITSFEFKKPLPPQPPTVTQHSLPQDIELPPSLQMFSPKFLTSTFLEVTRNYEYILSKARDVRKEEKERDDEVLLISPEVQSAEPDKDKSDSSDLDVVS
ncbi:zinc finger protein 652-like [Xyrichtys novacula]|uniref:Zinc finger protein 652-like n=1 Tax=Xyrichtys novacula TaxID=13765 RepID=A0AAV1HH17_XYRNO|nr:zinc finger protein 652-like [Xyrichtys novacula]